MVEFSLNNRFNFLYLPGMEIMFMNNDLTESNRGVVKTADLSCVELCSGEIVEKGLIFSIISKEEGATVSAWKNLDLKD